MGLIKRMFGKVENLGSSQRPPVADVPGAAVSESINQFAIECFGRLSSERIEDNLLLSPFSIASALAMILTGARGATAKQLADVLHFTEVGDRLQAELREVRALHERFDSWEMCDLRVANGLWGDDRYEFLESFREDLRDTFGGVFRDVDFRSSAESVRLEINDWVSNVTNNKIQELLEPKAIDGMTRLIAVNALYFHDEWLDTFDPVMTNDELFTLLDGRRVETPMMHQSKHYAYVETIGEQVLTIPYNSACNMIVILPKKRRGIGGLEKKIRSGAARPWEKGMRSHEVVLSLPKFRIETQVVLSGWLENMGVTEVFDQSRADLTGMATGESMERFEGLSLSEIFHKTFIEVDETGTEAAAATATIVITASLSKPPPPVIFTADHPFLFLIRVRKTGLILFMGRVADPTR